MANVQDGTARPLKTYAGDPGYQSYSYLDAGVDYEVYRLARQIDRVPSTQFSIGAPEEDRVQRLLEQHNVISLHDHTFILPEDLEELQLFRRQGRDWTGFDGLRVSGLDAIFDCLQNSTTLIHSKAGNKWDDILFDLGMRLSD